ncbi:MBL fold metallo-hydrolase [Marinobacter sp. NFXS9]|uniref:MBL fold metallo-hydrolase n=1 Tax=Marinobacter sp. NFXS9 TaxID=2818433 RepID=UPI0032DEDBA3
MNRYRNTAIALAASLFAAGSVQADAPMVKTQAPGYYRTMLGDFEITALSDGTVQLPVDKLLLNTNEAHVRDVLKAHFLSAPLETSVNGYLINAGDKLVLIDTGAGSLFGPTLGKLESNLEAAGYTPDEVDEIYITHMHPDHVGGLISDGNVVFPNATVRAAQADADYWLSKDEMESAPEGKQGFFKGAMASLNPYVESGHFKAFSGKTDLVDGIEAIPAHGHTPGHSIYHVESDGQSLMLMGDLIHVGSVQFSEPSIAIQFDSNPDQAVNARETAFDNAVDTGTLIGSAHLSFPGMGHLKAAGDGYDFIPVNYNATVVPPKSE